MGYGDVERGVGRRVVVEIDQSIPFTRPRRPEGQDS
jgi:hypothetical protein